MEETWIRLFQGCDVKKLRGVPRQIAILASLWAGLTTFASIVFAQEGMFVPDGNMGSGRCYHTATLLNNGKVLIAGRLVAATRFWLALSCPTPRPELLAHREPDTARFSHSATLLNNGIVLIAGGLDAADFALASAELYDPTTGTFTPTGSMNNARSSHSATLLNNGMVLITGGSSLYATGLVSAELYDPTTGTFTPTGSMNAPRTSHSVTLLNNGIVLIAGGLEGADFALASAELYDPTTRTFTPTGSMNNARSSHSATLLNNGSVLVAGGEVYRPTYKGSGFSSLTSAELYDSKTGTFTSTGSLNTARSSYTATLLNNGMVLIAGAGGLVTAELYDPATETFTYTGSLSVARYQDSVTLLGNGTVLVQGDCCLLRAPCARERSSHCGAVRVSRSFSFCL